ncbi:peptidyl-prolyl cis-trans isomerase [Marinomonas sp. M1K-6]|uniref:Peptidyl-prolyl cis-trans isomerase n=1 Tax=Marinomonas profundi TaxID=2726122 RepID=A0A847R8I7_9GAMM|nr:peptidylprolyl isomerase [Marinomonas profundi]NLQ16580.1 peptidyl-prolyl cis-trans isomerase [Marinomonas profundi]UDV03835.1 peptidyl-prolyl cis-trans isomerase [Marinomonas profundi]
MRKSIITGLALLLFCSQLQATEVDIVTNLGTIRVDLEDDAAPKTVANFLRYADEGFYEGTIFHRVIRGFMTQGGGFTEDLERKKTHKAVAYEGDNGLANNRGTLAMARTQDPNSATSQFFINQVDNVFLNHGVRGGAGYTVFGSVISGMDVVDAISAVSTSTVGPYQNVPTTPVIIESVTRVN